MEIVTSHNKPILKLSFNPNYSILCTPGFMEGGRTDFKVFLYGLEHQSSISTKTTLYIFLNKKPFIHNI